MCEAEEATTIAKVKMACAGLGNKAPRTGRVRQRHCPLCMPQRQEISEQHVLTTCPSVEQVRRVTGVSGLINSFRLVGQEEDEAYFSFINGLDTKGKGVSREYFLLRGKAMQEVVDAWLSRW